VTRAALLLIGLGVVSGPLGAQEFEAPDGPTGGQVARLGLANVAIVTGAAALKALLTEDQDWVRTVVAAAVGSTVHFGGKTLAARRDGPAGLLGRYTAATGASVTGNALVGRPPMGCVSLPVGPLWLNLADCKRSRVTVDVPTLLAGAVGASEGSLDVERSLLSGALVFRGPVRDGTGSVGWALGGVAFYNASARGAAAERHRVRHELTHVIQHDMAHLAFGRPLEDGLGRRLIPEDRALLQRVDLGFYIPLGIVLDRTPLRVLDRLEREARILDGTGR
jgi:hypothetical protein